MPRKNVFILGILCSFFFVIIGLLGNLTKGFPSIRYTRDQSQFLSHFENSIPDWQYTMKMGLLEKYREECNFYDLDKYRAGNSTRIPREMIASSCYTRDVSKTNSLFIWGDSHAEQLNFGLTANLPDNWQILQVASSGCAAQLRASPNLLDYCEYSNWYAYESIAKNKPDVVIVGQNLNHDVANMINIAEDLKSLGVKKIIFTGPTPHWTKDLPLIVVRLWDQTPRFTNYGLDTKVKDLDDSIKAHFPKSERATYISLMNELCSDAGCQIYIGEDRMLGITTWDYGHLTPIASEKIARTALVPLIIRASKETGN